MISFGMARMIFDLTDDDRASLERLRVARGLRSGAEVLRSLIREAAAGGFATVVAMPEPAKVVELTPLPADTPRYVKGVREPAAKPTPFKTRLKGEWKAP